MSLTQRILLGTAALGLAAYVLGAGAPPQEEGEFVTSYQKEDTVFSIFGTDKGGYTERYLVRYRTMNPNMIENPREPGKGHRVEVSCVLNMDGGFSPNEMKVNGNLVMKNRDLQRKVVDPFDLTNFDNIFLIPYYLENVERGVCETAGSEVRKAGRTRPS